MQHLQPANWLAFGNLKEWMSICSHNAPKEKKKGTISMIHMVAWDIWEERNRRVFQQREMTTAQLIRIVREEINLWNLAGAKIPFDPG